MLTTDSAPDLLQMAKGMLTQLAQRMAESPKKLWTNAWRRARTRDDGHARSTEGTLVSELGWPSGAFKRVANGLGWPKGDRQSAEVSRETMHAEPEPSPLEHNWPQPEHAHEANDPTGTILNTQV